MQETIISTMVTAIPLLLAVLLTFSSHHIGIFLKKPCKEEIIAGKKLGKQLLKLNTLKPKRKPRSKLNNKLINKLNTYLILGIFISAFILMGSKYLPIVLSLIFIFGLIHGSLSPTQKKEKPPKNAQAFFASTIPAIIIFSTLSPLTSNNQTFGLLLNYLSLTLLTLSIILAALALILNFLHVLYP